MESREQTEVPARSGNGEQSDDASFSKDPTGPMTERKNENRKRKRNHELTKDQPPTQRPTLLERVSSWIAVWDEAYQESQ